MNTNYKYTFILDSKHPVPMLEKDGVNPTMLDDTVKQFSWESPASAGSEAINKIIDYVEENCAPYKLILIGENPGHLEIYQSEDYVNRLFEVQLRMPINNHIIPLWR